MAIDRLALYTTIYRGCEPFLASFAESLRQQTDRDFDLCIGLDGITPNDVIAEIGLTNLTGLTGLTGVQWIIARPGETPADLRQRAFAMLVKSYDAVVFADADDLLQRSRIAAAREALLTSDVVGCALRFVDRQGRDLGLPSFGPESDADWHALLPRYNVFGLSNSAYRSETLARCLPLPPSCALIDWMLATRALVSGAVLRFDPAPRMAYRQHAHNIARVLPPFTASAVLALTTRVVSHYRLLLESDWDWPRGTRRPYEIARTRAEAFQQAMRSSPAALATYVTALNRITPRYVWWWAVAHPDLEPLWSPAASTDDPSVPANRPMSSPKSDRTTTATSTSRTG